MKVINSKDYEEKKLNLYDIVALRKWQKGLIITDVYGEVFCLSNKEYNTEAMLEAIICSNNMHFFKNGNRYLNLDFMKDTKTTINPAASTFAVKVTFDGGHEEIFNVANEVEVRSMNKDIIKRKQDSENALEI